MIDQFDGALRNLRNSFFDIYVNKHIQILLTKPQISMNKRTYKD